MKIAALVAISNSRQQKEQQKPPSREQAGHGFKEILAKKLGEVTGDEGKQKQTAW